MWKNININKNQIKIETDRSILINCPHNSNYDGFTFWHPSKLVRSGRHSAAISIGYNEDFKFRLIKYGKGKWNSRDIIDEKEISVEEFEKMFGLEDKNIVQPIEKNQFETHKPDEIKEIETIVEEKIEEELLDG